MGVGKDRFGDATARLKADTSFPNPTKASISLSCILFTARFPRKRRDCTTILRATPHRQGSLQCASLHESSHRTMMRIRGTGCKTTPRSPRLSSAGSGYALVNGFESDLPAKHSLRRPHRAFSKGLSDDFWRHHGLRVDVLFYQSAPYCSFHLRLIIAAFCSCVPTTSLLARGWVRTFQQHPKPPNKNLLEDMQGPAASS